MNKLENEEAAAIGFQWCKQLVALQAEVMLKPSETRIRRILAEILLKVGTPGPGAMAERLELWGKKKEDYEAKSEDLT